MQTFRPSATRSAVPNRAITPPIKPISAGHTLPLFNLHKEDFVVPFQFMNRESSYIVGSELLNQPLVLAFFSIHWNGYGEKYIKALQDLYADIQVMGGAAAGSIGRWPQGARRSGS